MIFAQTILQTILHTIPGYSARLIIAQTQAVDTVQDWAEKSTAYTFADGSKLVDHNGVFAATDRYVLIDNASGFIWWVGEAFSTRAACTAATKETGGDLEEYEPAHRLEINEGGYHVYVAPAGFEVYDGQDPAEINAVRALPFAGSFRVVD